MVPPRACPQPPRRPHGRLSMCSPLVTCLCDVLYLSRSMAEAAPASQRSQLSSQNPADPKASLSLSSSATSADIVILEGVYSARPELHDVLDILVLLDTPPEQRRRQLVEREGDHHRAEWEARWSAAEDHYFGVTMPPHCFDLVL